MIDQHKTLFKAGLQRKSAYEDFHFENGDNIVFSCAVAAALLSLLVGRAWQRDNVSQRASWSPGKRPDKCFWPPTGMSTRHPQCAERDECPVGWTEGGDQAPAERQRRYHSMWASEVNKTHCFATEGFYSSISIGTETLSYTFNLSQRRQLS